MFVSDGTGGVLLHHRDDVAVAFHGRTYIVTVSATEAQARGTVTHLYQIKARPIVGSKQRKTSKVERHPLGRGFVKF